jgi:hypothetical protein
MPLHFVRFLGEGDQSPGLLLVSQDAPVRDVIDALVLIWSASWPGEWATQIHHLPSLARHVFRR